QKYLDNGTGEFIKSDEYRQIVKQYNKKYDEVVQKAIPTQWQIGQEFQLKNLANVVDERVAAFDDLMASNPTISAKLQPNNWRKLTDQEKTAVVQEIADEYATKLGTPKVKIIVKKDERGLGGFYTPGTNEITLNSRYLDDASLRDVLPHEYGHLVDDLDPNAGALGSQYSYYGDKIYSSQNSKGYRIALTEQSSYAIGNTTGRTAEKTLDEAAAAGLGTVGGATIEIGIMDQLTNK
ncbi:MAG: hypothetical protein ACLRFJ_03595, partial [Alphaproteobacteria bacterium]